MKNVIKSVLIISLICFSVSVNAQTKPKFGHVDFAKLYSLMPGQDSAQIEYQEFAQSLKNTLDAMQAELESKYQDYQTSVNTLSAIIRSTKEKEIQDLQGRIEEFQMSAQQELQNKEGELTKPIIDKASQAVKEVAEENGYTYIFNSSEGMLLYSDPGDDVLSLVKKKLGIE
ncbi:MAG: OmpH family outer membrane protein [Bacteroidales bacterium]|nr:OmpH family outer membrane protein [Bacteroidales bacterium]